MEQLDINQHNDDTICAVSTPAGVGGIAVVRVSGRDAVKCVMKSFQFFLTTIRTLSFTLY